MKNVAIWKSADTVYLGQGVFNRLSKISLVQTNKQTKLILIDFWLAFIFKNEMRVIWMALKMPPVTPKLHSQCDLKKREKDENASR